MTTFLFRRYACSRQAPSVGGPAKRSIFKYCPQVTTLGQPLEVIKTQMAANRDQKLVQALRSIWSRGGVIGFYQGLIPWAWIEASTKGAVLIFTAAEVERAASSFGVSQATGGLLGGISGGVTQAYATMGKSIVFGFGLQIGIELRFS